MKPKTMRLISVIITLPVFLPAATLSFLWQAVLCGWAYGNWVFDPELFEARYKK